MTPDPRRTMTKGQRTRQRLLQAAIDRFGADGYRATSVSQLSRDAGLTPAAAYAYFADKETFWAAAIDADLDALSDEIRDAALHTDTPVFSLMAGLFGGLERHPLTRRVLAEGSEADLQMVLGHPLFAGTTAAIGARIAARQASGSVRNDAPADVLARGIETVVFSMLLSAVRAGLSSEPDRIGAVVAVLRHAVGGPPTPQELQGL